MSRSSEDVLLIVSHVKHKKTEGTLYMMSARMGWMLASKDTFNISINYADVKVQKVSPDTKEKVQLQVCMHDGSATTFHFINPKGRDAQKLDREGIKELLQQLLPKFKQKISSELEEKNRLLQEDPELFNLYKNLVVPGVVTAEEFWASHTDRLSSATTCKQDIGVSAAFLADVKPEADGANGLKYNLTADIIQAIFGTYPAVKKKHAENVPDKLTEQEFWTRFFQSHYFHRDRINISNKDLFAECAKSDDKEIEDELNKPVSDPLADLTAMSDSTLDSGYGLSNEDGKPGLVNAANHQLIKRFNLHSTMVLKACEKTTSLSTDSTKSQASESNAPNSRPATPASTSSMNGQVLNQADSPKQKRARIQEKLVYCDLMKPAANVGASPSLRITHTDRYLLGPTPIGATQYHTSEEILTACQTVTQEILAWTPKLPQVLSGSQAVSALGELSPGGALMQGTSRQQLHQSVSEPLQQELQQLYSALGELLRHFWNCFPVTSKSLEEKLIRMAGSLERFRQAKLLPFRDKLVSQHFPLNLLGHMDSQIHLAQQKYNTWALKRSGKKS